MADKYWWKSGGTGSSTGNWGSTTNWSSSSASYVSTTPPTSADNANFGSYSGSTAFTVTVTAGAVCANLVINNANMTLAGTGTWSVYGGVTVTAFASRTYTGTLTLAATTSVALAFGSMTLGNTLNFNGVGGTWTLATALTSTSAIVLTNGTLDTSASNYALTAFTMSLGAGTKSLILRGSTVTVSGTTVNFNTNSAGFTLNAGTSTFTFSYVLAKTLLGGGFAYNNINQASAGALTISNNNTFNNITNTVRPTTVIFTQGTTNTFAGFNLNGTAGNLVTIKSSLAGTRANLVKTGADVSCDYLSIQDLAAA